METNNLQNTINTCFKEKRFRKHASIKDTAGRYADPRTRKHDENGNAIHKFSAIGAANDYTKQVIDIIFNMIPNLKGSNAVTGYIRYGLTNRWPNRFQYTKREMDKLESAIKSCNNELIGKVIDLLNYSKPTKISKQDFIQMLPDAQYAYIGDLRKQPKITNRHFCEQSAKEFIESDEEQRIEILKRWASITLPDTDPSEFIVRFCIDQQHILQMQQDNFNGNEGGDYDNDITERLNSGELDREARIDGITDEDKQFAKRIINALHGSHQDLRDYSPEELIAYQEKQAKREKELFGDIYAEEDWSQDDED